MRGGVGSQDAVYSPAPTESLATNLQTQDGAETGWGGAVSRQVSTGQFLRSLHSLMPLTWPSWGRVPKPPDWGCTLNLMDACHGCGLRSQVYNVSLLYQQKARGPKPACTIQWVKKLNDLLKTKPENLTASESLANWSEGWNDSDSLSTCAIPGHGVPGQQCSREADDTWD